MLTDTPLSRAGSLPQGVCGARKIQVNHRGPAVPEKSRSTTGDLLCLKNPGQPQIKPVGASLLAKAPAHPTGMLTDTPLSRAGSLPQGVCGARKIQATTGMLKLEPRLV